MKLLKSLLLLTFVSTFNIYSQKVDTVFYNKDQSVANKKKFFYYSIHKELDTIIQIGLYDKKNNLITYGYTKSLETEDNSGALYYYSKNHRLVHLQLYQPNNYPEILIKFSNEFKYLEMLPDTFSLNVYYNKDGKIKSIGYMSNSCQKSGVWLTYFGNSDHPTYIATYQDNKYNGSFSMFKNDGIPMISGIYKDDKKHGAWDSYYKGKKILTDFYIDGKKVKTIRYSEIN